MALAAVPEPDPANRLRQRPVVGGEPPDAGDLPAGCAFAPRCPVAIAGTCEQVVPPLIELDDGRDRVEAALAFGATWWEAARPVAAESLRSGMIPILNTMSVVGIVTIPGMMTGQLLVLEVVPHLFIRIPIR